MVYGMVGLMSLATTYGVPVVSDLYRHLRELLTTSGATPIGGLRRVTGLAFEPSFAGFEYAAWWLPIAFTLALYRRTRVAGVVLGSAFLLAALGTQSITALISLGALLIVAIVTLFRRARSGASAGLVLAASLVALIALSSTPSVLRVASRVSTQLPDFVSGEYFNGGPRDPSLSERAALLHNAVNIAVAHPLFGAGFGLAGYRFGEFRPAWTYNNPYLKTYEAYLSDPDGNVFPSAKNLYVRIWSETGIVGLFLLLAFIRTGFARAIRASRQELSFQGAQWLGVATILGLIASSVAYLSLDSFGIPFLWAWLGIASGANVR